MLPPERGDVRQAIVWNRRPQLRAGLQGLVQIGRVPKRDGRDHKIHGHSVDVLLQPGAIADRALSVKPNRPLQRVVRLALVQPNGDPATKVRILKPLQRKQRPSFTTSRSRLESSQ